MTDTIAPQVVFLAYIPVLHRGYLEFFNKFPNADTLLLISPDFAQQYEPLHKDIRALPQETLTTALDTIDRFHHIIQVTSSAELKAYNTKNTTVIVPKEPVSLGIVEHYLPKAKTIQDSIFLRWTKDNAQEEIEPHSDHEISKEKRDAQLMQAAKKSGELSGDWWRRVGAVAVLNDTVIATAHNTHMPSEHEPYEFSDARAYFHKGERIDLTTAIHAEAKLIAEAAREGVALKGAHLYVTDFPCPVCAKSIATAGFSKLYYESGYSVMDGQDVLKHAGVKLIRVVEK